VLLFEETMPFVSCVLLPTLWAGDLQHAVMVLVLAAPLLVLLATSWQ